MGILIQGGTLVTAEKRFKADIRVEGETIREIGTDLPPNGDTVLDADGKLVFPGFIDTHTHFDLEGAARTADDFYTGTKAAAIGGTTCVLDFTTQERGQTSLEALDHWHKKADGVSSCDYSFHMSYTEWNPALSEELPQIIQEGITSFKLYMAYDNLKVSDSVMAEILSEIKKFGGIVGCHCEIGDVVKAGIARELAAGHTAPNYHPVSRPAEVEADAVKRYLEIARDVDIPVNIVHLSTAKGLEEVRKARAAGQKLFVETCPQYLVFDDSAYEPQGDDPFEGAKFVLSPPLRKKEDAAALWEALAGGEIETIGTDHCSFHYKGHKDLGRDDFSKIPNGLPGVEHRAVLLYTYGVKSGKLTENQMAAVLAENPAKLFGMYPQKGCLKPGADADIVIWNPEKNWTISESNQHHAVDYTPYEGLEVTGQAETVLLRGEVIVSGGECVKEKVGKFIARNRSVWFD